MITDIEIIDNFLDEQDFKNLKTILNEEVPWSFSNYVAHKNEGLDQFYFVHNLFQNFQIRSPLFRFFYNTFIPKLQITSLIRAKFNLYPRTHHVVKHGWHRDFDVPHKGAVFYVNSCDGYTGIGEQKVHSVENRLLKFDSSRMHYSTTCTDATARITLNINYF